MRGYSVGREKPNYRTLYGVRALRKIQILLRKAPYTVADLRNKAINRSARMYLRNHPEICMTDKKEIHFFNGEENFTNGNPDYSKYHAWFDPRKEHKILGEATPICMYWHDAPKRIWEYSPEMKLIILLRALRKIQILLRKAPYTVADLRNKAINRSALKESHRKSVFRLEHVTHEKC